MLNIALILLGKLISQIAKISNLGNGSTWPGHIALRYNPHFIQQLLSHSHMQVIIVAGTNGKTTTSKLIAHILEKSGHHVLQNESGANLLNGIASSMLLRSTIMGKLPYEYAIFEVDENALPKVLQGITPNVLVLLNLFRDQLDRYGEVNIIADKWKQVVQQLPETTTLILNADDPQIAYLGYNRKAKTKYFSYFRVSIHGTSHESDQHVMDSSYCPHCGEKLLFKTTTFSHLGDWSCKKCGLKRPQSHLLKWSLYPLTGAYNAYNTNAAVITAITCGLTTEKIKKALVDFKPAFGRQEILDINEKKIQLFLSKNPTGFNESLRTVKESGGKHLLFVLNDRIPDGKDVSWIWDTDLENILTGDETITVTGERVYDMALRIKYSGKFKIQNTKFKIEEDLKNAVQLSITDLPKNETLYVLPTYTAMLETRKILTGRKIL